VADIEERIEQRIRAFADELRALIREAAHQAIDEALGATTTPTSTSRRSNAKPTSSKTRRRPSPKGTRRTTDQMQRDLDALREHVRRHPGMTALEISAALGMANREITRPIKKLIAAGDVRKTGVKSSTRYYPTDSPAPASAERHAGNSSPRSATR
jgi:hypothetical protein